MYEQTAARRKKLTTYTKKKRKSNKREDFNSIFTSLFNPSNQIKSLPLAINDKNCNRIR